MAIITAFAVTVAANASEWVIDQSHSNIGFSVKHMMVSTVHGSFAKYTAKVNFDETKSEALSVEAEIEIASIDTRVQQRDDHLRSADFFDAANHPLMTFKSKKAKALGNGKFEVTGDLMIRGVTKEVTLAGEGFSLVSRVRGEKWSRLFMPRL